MMSSDAAVDIPAIGIWCPLGMSVEHCVALAEELQAETVYIPLTDQSVMTTTAASTKSTFDNNRASSSAPQGGGHFIPQRRWGLLTEGSGPNGWARQAVGVIDRNLRWDDATDRSTISHLLGMAEYLSLSAVLVPPPLPPTSGGSPSPTLATLKHAALDIASLLLDFSDNSVTSSGTTESALPLATASWRERLVSQLGLETDAPGSVNTRLPTMQTGWGGGCALSTTQVWLPCRGGGGEEAADLDVLRLVRGLLGQEQPGILSGWCRDTGGGWSSWEGVRRNWHLHSSLYPVLMYNYAPFSSQPSYMSSLGAWAAEAVQAVVLPLPVDLSLIRTFPNTKSGVAVEASFWDSPAADRALWGLMTDLHITHISFDLSGAFQPARSGTGRGDVSPPLDGTFGPVSSSESLLDGRSIREALPVCCQGLQRGLSRIEFAARRSSLPAAWLSPPQATHLHLLSATYWRIRRLLRRHEGRLQEPLQPLADHLLNRTYGIFEQDDAKYLAYENAVCRYFKSVSTSGPLHAVVLGAGRGPLVSCVLRAYSRAQEQRANRGTALPPLLITAVEKNPYAYRILKCRGVADEEWRRPVATGAVVDVRLAFGDGRGGGLGEHHASWLGQYTEVWRVATQAPHQPTDYSNDPPVSVVVSELLGSFGDNELSPECIDGFLSNLDRYHNAQAERRVVGDKNDTEARRATTPPSRSVVSIPGRYQAMIEPVSSFSMQELVRGLVGRGGGVPSGMPYHSSPQCALSQQQLLHHCDDRSHLRGTTRVNGAACAMHVPYVVLPSSFRSLSMSGPQPVFAFSHGAQTVHPAYGASEERDTSSLPPASRRIFSQRTFPVGGAGEVGQSLVGCPIHGLLGYFECSLFNEDAEFISWARAQPWWSAVAPAPCVTSSSSSPSLPPAAASTEEGASNLIAASIMWEASATRANILLEKGLAVGGGPSLSNARDVPDPFDLSTVPATHTPSMASWFSIFFPVVWPATTLPSDGAAAAGGGPYSDVGPMVVMDGDAVLLRMWRCSCPCNRGGSVPSPSPSTSTSGGCVWYEWQVGVRRKGDDARSEAVQWSTLMNEGGLGSVIGL